MAEGGHDGAWYCAHRPQFDEQGLRNFCPEEGCPKDYCARDAGWNHGEPSPGRCMGYVISPVAKALLERSERDLAKVLAAVHRDDNYHARGPYKGTNPMTDNDLALAEQLVNIIAEVGMDLGFGNADIIHKAAAALRANVEVGEEILVPREPSGHMLSDGAFQIFRGERITEDDLDSARRVWRAMTKAALAAKEG